MNSKLNNAEKKKKFKYVIFGVKEKIKEGEKEIDFPPITTNEYQITTAMKSPIRRFERINNHENNGS